MSRGISARLTTLCGCTRYQTVESPAPSELRVLIQALGDLNAPTFYRTFRLRSLSPTDAPVEADYVEVFS